MVSYRIFDNYLSIVLIIGLNTILISVAQPELKLVNVVFRHGDRTPDKGYEMYPTDPYLNYSFYPEGLGQLTMRGKMREYELGQFLSDRYKNSFLGDVYLPKLVVARSSDYDRTKMSLQLVLAALFPPVNPQQRWNPDLNWQPIPASYVPRVEDNLILPDECPLYLNEYNRVLNLPEIQKTMARFTNMMSTLTELTGKNIATPLDLYFLYHTFMAELSANLTLPEWAHNYFPNGQLLDAIVTAYNIASYTPLLRKLYAGPLIRVISENMAAARNPNPPSTKIYLYSGHETNIAALLHAFNVYTPHAPAYSSAVILELLEQDKRHYVKLLYYRGIPPLVDELEIPGCETLCPFDTFSNLIRDVIPTDEEKACDKRQTAQ